MIMPKSRLRRCRDWYEVSNTSRKCADVWKFSLRDADLMSALIPIDFCLVSRREKAKLAKNKEA